MDWFAAVTTVALLNVSPYLHCDWRVRESIIDGQVTSEWVRLAKNDDPDTRLAAIRALKQCFPKKAIVEQVASAVHDPDPRVRRAAASWGSLSEEQLSAFLGDPDADVRFAAHNSICWKDQKRTPPSLLFALHDPSDEIRHFAVSRLAHLKFDSDVYLPILFKLWEADQRKRNGFNFRAVFQNVREQSLPFAVRLTSSADPKLRLNAINLCRYLGAPAPVLGAIYRKAIDDPDEEIRLLALGSIGIAENRRSTSLPLFLRKLKSNDPKERRAAIDGLVYSTSLRDNISIILRLTTDKREDVRSAALDALRYLSRKQKIDLRPLLPRLKDANVGSRFVTLFVIANRGDADAEVVREVIAAMRDNTQIVANLACDCLAHLRCPDSTVIRDALVDALRDDRLAMAASIHLAKFDPEGRQCIPRIVERIHASIADCTEALWADRLIEFGEAGQEAIVELAKSPDLRICCLGLSRMTKLGPDQFRAIERALAVDDTAMRLAALKAIGRLNQKVPELTKAIVTLMDDGDDQIRYYATSVSSLIAPSNGTIRTLIARLTDPEESVRTSAFQALINIEPFPREARPALLAALAANPIYGTYDALQKLSADDARLDPILFHHIRNGRIDWELFKFMLLNGSDRKELSRALVDRLESERLESSENTNTIIHLIGELRWAPARGIPLLMDCACDADPAVRRHAVHALGKLGPTAIVSIPLLVARRGDEDAEVRASATRAIETLFSLGNDGRRRGGPNANVRSKGVW